MLAGRQAVDNSTGILYTTEPIAPHTRHTTHRPNLHGELKATALSTTFVALLAVGLRIFTRTRLVQGGLHTDDYMVMVGLLFSVLLLGINFKHLEVGLGYHIWDVPLSDFTVPFQVMTLVGTIFYATSLAFTKISILCFYLRLSPQAWFRWLVWTLIGIVTTYAVVYNLLSIFACWPLAATWDATLMPTAKCIDPLTKYVALSILNIIIDVFTLVLPIPVIAPLHMGLKQKITVCLLFATGAFVCAVAVRRTILLEPLMTSTDYTWAAVEQFHWCFAEVNASIVCASVSALKPFFWKYIPGLISSRYRSYAEGKYYQGGSAPFEHNSEGRKIPRHRGREVYELESRDDASELSDRMKLPIQGVDDEARLWESEHAMSPHHSTLAGNTGRRSSSVCHATYPEEAKRHSGTKATNQIWVKSETRISYSKS
ncbi:hypothetical protein BU24DRAFT_487875 [Aaosphaeria arxii CBS 175.79]|uniref:Rhodopsin domain-containing protein n=1 Tax=Aaosphaeria arxii CBS 175.79 TaxID=1450172 RepID=A0A6A5Y9H1_9PLEO|nr:uncharacterized protein BU24DRAFT_487875 [Aaosphaeria arxii CBS 175.79]KAF2021460.1 hypothetical protein BU24DRAFT_487875 [Aaosphaeria arxii CBS 175.79]